MIPILVLLVFVLGFSAGIAVTVAYIVHLGNRFRKKETFPDSPDYSGEAQEDAFQKHLDSNKKKPSLDEKMMRIRQITEEQLSLMSKIENPQKNSLDGKYKNQLNSVVKDLEEEKNTLLKSVLDGGDDPEISTVDAMGVVTRMKLSDFMIESGLISAPKLKSEVRKVGKFIVIKGGKDDSSGGNTSH